MLSFFPTPYPDEILYSVFARYHARSGNIKPDETLQELFNSRNIIVRPDLPYNLSYLIKNLPLLSQHTVESLIQKHTLYPMYAGTFECDCGFQYSKIGVNLTKVDKFRFERIVTFGQLWEQKYLELNVVDRLNFQQAAYNLSFNYSKSPMTMLRKLEALWKSLNDSVGKDAG